MSEKLNKTLKVFLRHIDAIRDTLPMTMLLVGPYNKKANDDFIKFLEEKGKEITDENGDKKILVKAEDSQLFESLEKNASISAIAGKIIPESLFVSLISQYDAFLGRLLRAIYEIKPELLNGSERNLTFSQLVDMNSLEDAREYIIEKEIDTVLRKSHAEQFDYLERLIKIPLRENLPIWQKFIEITERRNLLVHTDGVVSNQYLKNCKEHGCPLNSVKVNERLGISPEYFLEGYNCLYEISVKLTHTIWRKLLNNDLKKADGELNEICYNLINNKLYSLADILLEFAGNQKKFFNDKVKNVYIINAALSKYSQNKISDARAILDRKDWSASSDDFQLAYTVLTENFDDAFSIMRRIGKDGSVKKSDYKQWPLFSKIRVDKRFKIIFKEIFGEDYTIMETPKKPLQELVEDRKKGDEQPELYQIKKLTDGKKIEPITDSFDLNKSMKGRRRFTVLEINQLRELVESKANATQSQQIAIRRKLRKLGFFFSDFSSKRGYTVKNFDELINKGLLQII